MLEVLSETTFVIVLHPAQKELSAAAGAVVNVSTFSNVPVLPFLISS